MRKDLRAELGRIDGRGYPAYKDIQGEWAIGEGLLFVDWVQGDPFANPSQIRLRLPGALAAWPSDLYQSKIRRVALEDYLTRAVARAIPRLCQGRRGTGKSGLVVIDTPGQEVLERTSMKITREFVEVRLAVGLPAQGRSVLAREAQAMLLDELPRLMAATLPASSHRLDQVKEFVEVIEDQEVLRALLPERGLVAFVGEGAILPRASGVDQRPMNVKEAIPFQIPPGLGVEFTLPNRGKIKGMGIGQGVTLICGGGYHGKSTLLAALEHGVYNQIPGDGREWVLTHPTAVKIRAEDGRRVEGVDISPFITNLPFGRRTDCFSSEDASGSTSQAANIMEALEIGTRLLLLDEDTSATNFMIRDRRMQALVAKEKEPITPFIDRVRQLYTEHQVSTILVVGGSGDYFDVADSVLVMEEYQVSDGTEQARLIAREYPAEREWASEGVFGRLCQRSPQAQGVDPYRGDRVKIRSRGTDEISFGVQEIDLQSVEQIVHPSQTRAIAEMIRYAGEHLIDGDRTLSQILELIMAQVEVRGLDVLGPRSGQHPGDLALPRSLEVAAAFNRLRSIRMKQEG